MAQITDLPEEVIVIIVRRLDFQSQCSMYKSCKFFRNLLSLLGIVVGCNMSLNSAATVKTLNLDFFKTISNHLIVLNMCGVPDLTKTKVLPAFKKLKHLKVLDISYTNLNMSDLIAIHHVCPTLNDITIDFKFPQTIVQISEDLFRQYQTLFKHFENVHFVGSLNNLLSSTVVLQILNTSKLNTLKFSVVEKDNVHTTIVSSKVTDCQMPHFSHFAVFLLVNWKSISNNDDISKFPVISKIALKNYEFCVIYSLNRHKYMTSIYATPLISKFFKDYFNISTISVSNYMADPKGNVAFMVWNRETTCFDDNFFNKLYTRVKPYFPFHHEPDSIISCPQNYDWIYINPAPIKNIDIFYSDQREKKRRTSMPNILLDYDNLLKHKYKAQLSMIFLTHVVVSVSLPYNGQYFSKITLLNLSGTVRYCSDFFSNLFVWCHNLVTLSVECMSVGTGYASNILHAIKESQSLKNLRIIDKKMNLKQLFDSLSKCKTLENIHVVDLMQWDHCQIADPALLVQSCANLYSVFVEGLFTDTNLTKQLQMFNNAKISYRRTYLRVVINPSSNIKCLFGYNPFLDVFKLNAIKPI